MNHRELQILRPIKEGGQKEVYEAEHPDLGKVAYKTGTVRSLSAMERIKRESLLLNDINNRAFPKNHSFETDTDGLTFHIIEEYIEGETLGVCAHRFRSENPIIQLLLELLNALELIWDRRVIHRDLKPDNLMIRNDGSLVVIDLGIARFLDLTSLTDSLGLHGPCTPAYAAPEQLRNDKDLIDVRTDFFSMGTVLAELALGHHPFDPRFVGNDVGIVENILTGNYTRISETKGFSSQFIYLIDRLLKVRQYQRFRRPVDINDFIVDNWEV